ncbi:MAG TPA: hypothetical protein DDY13_14900 [Cytophagales bacterium]|nr:hypothetical protein [Cytophagales bacterium]
MVCINATPVSGKKDLAESFTNYPYSSEGLHDLLKENNWVRHYKNIWCGLRKIEVLFEKF